MSTNLYNKGLKARELSLNKGSELTPKQKQLIEKYTILSPSRYSELVELIRGNTNEEEITRTVNEWANEDLSNPPDEGWTIVGKKKEKQPNKETKKTNIDKSSKYKHNERYEKKSDNYKSDKYQQKTDSNIKNDELDKPENIHNGNNNIVKIDRNDNISRNEWNNNNDRYHNYGNNRNNNEGNDFNNNFHYNNRQYDNYNMQFNNDNRNNRNNYYSRNNYNPRNNNNNSPHNNEDNYNNKNGLTHDSTSEKNKQETMDNSNYMNSESATLWGKYKKLHQPTPIENSSQIQQSNTTVLLNNNTNLQEVIPIVHSENNQDAILNNDLINSNLINNNMEYNPEIDKNISNSDIINGNIVDHYNQFIEVEPEIKSSNMKFSSNDISVLKSENKSANITHLKELQTSQLDTIYINTPNKILDLYSSDDISLTNDIKIRPPPTKVVNLGKYSIYTNSNIKFKYVQSQPPVHQIQPSYPLATQFTQTPPAPSNSQQINDLHNKPVDQKLRSSQDVEREIQESYLKDPIDNNRNPSIHPSYHQPTPLPKENPPRNAQYIYPYVPHPQMYDNRNLQQRHDGQPIQPEYYPYFLHYFPPPPSPYSPYIPYIPPSDNNNNTNGINRSENMYTPYYPPIPQNLPSQGHN